MSTVKKSHATAAWECRNRDQVMSDRFGAGSMTGDAVTVPAEEGVGCDDPAVSILAGERCCDRAEQGPIIVVNGGSAVLLDACMSWSNHTTEYSAPTRGGCVVSTNDRISGTHRVSRPRTGRSALTCHPGLLSG